MVLLTEHDLIIRRALVASRGREVKHTGDGIMASFDDVAKALECSVAIQDAFDARNAGGAAQDLRVRIGMAGGQPVRHNDDIFGSTVNLAAASAMPPSRGISSHRTSSASWASTRASPSTTLMTEC